MSLEFLAYPLGSIFTKLSMKPPQVTISNIQHTMDYMMAVGLLPYNCPSFILFGKGGGDHNSLTLIHITKDVMGMFKLVTQLLWWADPNYIMTSL